MPLIIINTAPQNMIKGMPSLELTNIPDNCEATKRVTIKPTILVRFMCLNIRCSVLVFFGTTPILPTFILYIFLSEKIIGGVTGGIKG